VRIGSGRFLARAIGISVLEEVRVSRLVSSVSFKGAAALTAVAGLGAASLGQVACPAFSVPGAAVRPIAPGQTGVLEAHVQSGARFVTNDGTIDIDLMLAAAPNTSANFLSYVRSGKYNGIVFHRSVPFSIQSQIGVIQGGGFTGPTQPITAYPTAQNPLVPAQKPTAVVTYPPIAIEHPVGNVRGTLSMARTSQLVSATSQFFINTVDNNVDVPGQRFSLDAIPGTPGREGYAVFGAVTPASLAVVDTIKNRSIFDASGLLGNFAFGETPFRRASSDEISFPLVPADYVTVSSATVRTTPLASYAGNAGWTYQWKRNGVDVVDDGRITGATTGTLSIASMTAADFGEYRCVVTGLACTGGSESSDIVKLFCPSDLGVAGGAVGSDGMLDNNDFISFIGLFFNGDARADLGSAGGVGGADGAFDNNDFIVFINRFFDGC
jgi:peptidyl-prolyl cis-trans isomerase A (cyclophilin A)